LTGDEQFSYQLHAGLSYFRKMAKREMHSVAFGYLKNKTWLQSNVMINENGIINETK